MVLCIYCAGGNGKIVVDLAREIKSAEHRWDEILFVDDVVIEKEIYGTKVLCFTELEKNYDVSQVEFVISIGEPTYRKVLYEKIKQSGYGMTNLIDSNAWIPEGTQIGEGVIIGDCKVGSDVIIGTNSFVGVYATIGHDTIVGEHSNISTNCFVGGHCTIGNEVYMGPQAAMRDRITVEDTAVIAMSAAVFKNVPGNSIAIGNPAKCIKKEDGYRVFS